MLEWAAQGDGGVTVPGGVQETFRCGTEGHGLVGKLVVGQVAQRGGGCPVLGDIQGQAGQGSEPLIWLRFYDFVLLFFSPPFPVGGEQISSIGRGLCVLLGISLEDTQRELEHM